MDSAPGERILARLLEDEMRESFIDYSMSVIVRRALPDVRDGLKPVHRRILYAMSELGLGPTRPYKKSATVVGEVLGKYHPHGDSAVYDSMARMVQDFSLRYPLVDGQGNFGSIDGDSPAAYRYTEARLTPLATQLLTDIDEETVDFIPNFDGRIDEPTVLPARAPNLLVNGSSGIAVGMATNIPPHNLREVVDATIALIENPDLPQEVLESIVTGPDFPTGAFICGRRGIRDAYRTGRGRIVMRARADVEEAGKRGNARIVVRAIPFMVNKTRLIEQIAQMVREKKLTQVSALRDESDRDGMRIVIELKRATVPQVVLNLLYKHTQMQATFGTILLALVNGVPRVMGLREILFHFVDHRHDVVVRRSEFRLAKARAREHILEGLEIAVDNIDRVIAIIRSSPDTATAMARLRAEEFRVDAQELARRADADARLSDGEASLPALPPPARLTERQAEAILNMRLARLTGLEIDKLERELADVRAVIAELDEILSSRLRRMQIIVEELREVAKRFGDDRRTEILTGVADLEMEDLIKDEEVVLTVSRQGYLKRIPLTAYRAQRRGGRGLKGMATKDEDEVGHLFVANTHDYLMIFTRSGKCHWIKVWEAPDAGRYSRGKPVVNLRNIDPRDGIAAFVPVRTFAPDCHLLFCTRKGIVKKTPLSAYGNVRMVGIHAIRVDEDDELIDVQITDGASEVLLATREGMDIRFHESDVRPMGRVARGVNGIRLREGDEVVGMMVPSEDSSILVATRGGMGKRSAVGEYRLQRRGGFGVINMKTNDRTGPVVAVKAVHPSDELMLVTRNGVVNRQRVEEIRVIGRLTQGVRLLNLDDNDELVDLARVMGDNGDGEEAGREAEGNGPQAGREAVAGAERERTG